MNPRVESTFTDEQLDEVLDTFEREWSRDDGFLHQFVNRESVGHSAWGLAELIRADIDRRYSAGVEVDLANYFKLFPGLRNHKSSAHAIAYEDFRGRSSRGLSIHGSRWSWVAEIQEADWFRALEQSVASDKPANRRSAAIEPAIEPAIETASAAKLEPQVGEPFGEFQLLSLLGIGAFSRVFLATQSSLAGRYVALKVVRQTLDEPTHLARLQHTGIVPLYSVHRIGSYSALCMPYYGSATLADWLGEQSLASERNGQSLVTTVNAALNKLTQADEMPCNAPSANLMTQEADRIRVWNSAGSQLLQKLSELDSRKFLLWFARHVAAALAHAHERGIIHGDLKPANILLRNDGEPALIDFNLSKDNELKQLSWAGGTLPYMSPEQLQMMIGQRFQTSTSSDVYSLGLILYEVLENRSPFPAPLSAAETDIKAAFVARNSPFQFTNKHATAGLQAIITKCLQLEPKKRYDTASELLEDIDREIANLPLSHAVEGFVASRLPKLIRRYPRVFATVPVALFCLSIIAIFALTTNYWWRSSKALAAKSQLSTLEREARQQLPQLLSEKPNLAKRLAQAARTAEGYIGVSSKDFANSSNLIWLSAADRTSAENLIFDYCLSSAAVALESGNSRDDAERASVRKLLGYCELVPERAQQSPLLQQLQQILGEGKADSAFSDSINADSPIRPAATVEDLLLARASVLNNQPALALTQLARISSLSKSETSPFAHLYWLTAGDAQSQLGQYDAALLSYELAIGAASEAAISYERRAKLRVTTKKLKSAELDYSAAINLSPQNVAYYVDRALVREQLHDLKGAREDLDQALELAPDSNRIALIRARLHQLLGETEAVREDMKRAMTSEPKTVEDWISRALAQLPRFPDRALRDLRAAEALAPNSADVLQNLAYVHSEHLKDMPAAVAALDRILDADANNEMARGGRCVLLARLGKDAEAFQDIESLSQLGERAMPATLFQMGCAHALLSPRHSESQATAIKYIAKALKRNYGAELLDTDSDLAPIRELPDFAALKTASKIVLENTQP